MGPDETGLIRLNTRVRTLQRRDAETHRGAQGRSGRAGQGVKRCVAKERRQARAGTQKRKTGQAPKTVTLIVRC